MHKFFLFVNSQNSLKSKNHTVILRNRNPRSKTDYKSDQRVIQILKSTLDKINDA